MCDTDGKTAEPPEWGRVRPVKCKGNGEAGWMRQRSIGSRVARRGVGVLFLKNPAAYAFSKLGAVDHPAFVEQLVPFGKGQQFFQCPHVR